LSSYSPLYNDEEEIRGKAKEIKHYQKKFSVKVIILWLNESIVEHNRFYLLVIIGHWRAS
jgi:hypothetical protein